MVLEYIKTRCKQLSDFVRFKGEVPSANMKKGNSGNIIELLRMRNSNVLEVLVNHN